MSEYIERADRLTLPVVVMRGMVAFPSIPVNFEIYDSCFGSQEAAACAAKDGSYVFLVPLEEPSEEPTGTPDVKMLHKTGVIAKIKQFINGADTPARVVAEGMARATVSKITQLNNYTVADILCKTVTAPNNGGVAGEALIREASEGISQMLNFLPSASKDFIFKIQSIKNPGLLSDFTAANLFIRYTDKLDILDCFDPMKRIELLNIIITEETELLKCEAGIHRKVREKLNRNQKEYYLREQIRAIQEELGEGGSDTDEYFDKISRLNLPKEIEKKLVKETEKLSRVPYGSAEATVIANYLDVCLEIPWTKSSKDRVDVAAAKKILDNDHDGLDKVKERILEFLAVKQLAPDLKNQIICLVGPPGTGKTSIAASVAASMKRKYVRVSLGGIRDEADIRGHRKTYIGAMPGRIITAITQAGVNNPLILLDEIDKMTKDAHGDPTSAMLEVLDPEQNKFFRDHFTELPFDLSECVFIATANSLDTIPKPLLDRMEIIRLDSYTGNEKLMIAKNHLIPKQLKRHGLNRRMLKIDDSAIVEIINYYTRESGVRELERNMAALSRKAAKKFVENSELKHISVDETNVKDYLGARKIVPDRISNFDEVGCVNGLAWTEVGGEMLKVEVAVLEGTGKLELTGSLGDVMKESAHAALTYVRSIAAQYGIPSDFYKTKDIHIHLPEGAVPKDGPSAGVTMMTALLSALSGIPVRRDVAMTGEITLRGNVLPIGGLKEKTMAAYSAGVSTVLIPEKNISDLENIDKTVRESLTFIPCTKASDVLANALAKPEEISDCFGESRICRPQTDKINAPITEQNINSVGIRAK